jgi:hypothetical protein
MPDIERSLRKTLSLTLLCLAQSCGSAATSAAGTDGSGGGAEAGAGAEVTGEVDLGGSRTIWAIQRNFAEQDATRLGMLCPGDALRYVVRWCGGEQVI